MQRPVTLLRWAFGPQPPNANAGVAVDDRAAKRTTVAAAQKPDQRATRTTFMTISPSPMRVGDHCLVRLSRGRTKWFSPSRCNRPPCDGSHMKARGLTTALPPVYAPATFTWRDRDASQHMWTGLGRLTCGCRRRVAGPRTTGAGVEFLQRDDATRRSHPELHRSRRVAWRNSAQPRCRLNGLGREGRLRPRHCRL